MVPGDGVRGSFYDRVKKFSLCKVLARMRGRIIRFRNRETKQQQYEEKKMFRPEEIENGVTWDNGIRGSIFNGFNGWN